MTQYKYQVSRTSDSGVTEYLQSDGKTWGTKEATISKPANTLVVARYDADGKLYTYNVTEVNASNGTVYDEAYLLGVKTDAGYTEGINGKTVSVSFADNGDLSETVTYTYRAVKTIKIAKTVTDNSGTSVKNGWIFHVVVTNSEGTTVVTYDITTDANGNAVTGKTALPIGDANGYYTYTVTETGAPEGYTLDEYTVQFTCGTGDKTSVSATLEKNSSGTTILGDMTLQKSLQCNQYPQCT